LRHCGWLGVTAHQDVVPHRHCREELARFRHHDEAATNDIGWSKLVDALTVELD